MSEYKSTVVEIEDFLSSLVWKDIQYELNRWVEDIRRELESPDRTPDIYMIRQLQGNLAAVHKVLQMPYVIIDNIKEDRDRKETKYDREPE